MSSTSQGILQPQTWDLWGCDGDAQQRKEFSIGKKIDLLFNKNEKCTKTNSIDLVLFFVLHNFHYNICASHTHRGNAASFAHLPRNHTRPHQKNFTPSLSSNEICSHLPAASSRLIAFNNTAASNSWNSWSVDWSPLVISNSVHTVPVIALSVAHL